MDFTKKIKMTEPTPVTLTYNIDTIVIGVCALVSILIGWLAFVNASFKNKAAERETFIKAIAEAKVDDKLKELKLDDKLQEMRGEFVVFMRRMEDKFENLNKIVFEALNKK